MIPLEYPHLEDYVEELLLIQTRYREKNGPHKQWILMIYWKTGWSSC